MKLIPFALSLPFLLGCSCRDGNTTRTLAIAQNSATHNSDGAESTDTVALAELPDYIYVTHQWKDLDESVYPFGASDGHQVAKWKSEFEKANAPDSVWRDDFLHVPGEDHWMAVYDFVGLWHGQYRESFKQDDDRTVWRLLQYSPEADRVPSLVGFDRVRFLRHIYEDLLDYEPYSQWDMTFWAWLETDFDTFYIRILNKDILSLADRRLTSAIRREQAKAGLHHDRVWEAYQKVQGEPGFNGTSFPYRCGTFGDVYYKMEIQASEAFLQALYDDSYSYPVTGRTVTDEDVVAEFDTFSRTFEEDEYSYTPAERKAVLDRDRRSFLDWMKARGQVSALLSGKAKETYDKATDGIRRYKLVLLKNRYYYDDGYCLDYVSRHLLGFDCSDEELFSHNLEKLIENE